MPFSSNARGVLLRTAVEVVLAALTALPVVLFR